MYKERLRLVEKDQVDQWKATLSQLENEFKTEINRLSNEIWGETRRHSPRTMCLGADVLGNKYWLFSSRKTKERDFGGWVVVEIPEGRNSPTGEACLVTPSETVDNVAASEDEYSDLKSWFFVEKVEDVKQLSLWARYLAAKSAQAAAEPKESKAKGTPNRLGQKFAVEITASPRMIERISRGKKTLEYAGTVTTRALCQELERAAEWIDEKFTI